MSGLSAEYLTIEDVGSPDDSSTTSTSTTAITMTPERQMHEQIVTQVCEMWMSQSIPFHLQHSYILRP